MTPVLGVSGTIIEPAGVFAGVLGDAFEPAMGIGPCDDDAAPLYIPTGPAGSKLGLEAFAICCALRAAASARDN